MSRRGSRRWAGSPALVSYAAGAVRNSVERRERKASGRNADEAQRRIDQIERQRRSWAEKTANGAIHEDVDREKQNELTQQLVRARPTG